MIIAIYVIRTRNSTLGHTYMQTNTRSSNTIKPVIGFGGGLFTCFELGLRVSKLPIHEWSIWSTNHPTSIIKKIQLVQTFFYKLNVEIQFRFIFCFITDIKHYVRCVILPCVCVVYGNIFRHKNEPREGMYINEICLIKYCKFSTTTII